MKMNKKSRAKMNTKTTKREGIKNEHKDLYEDEDQVENASEKSRQRGA